MLRPLLATPAPTPTRHPHLFFDGSDFHGKAASIDYAVEKQTLFGLQIGQTRNNWRIGIFECFSAQDTGLNCFCAHCCCSIWTWESAVSLVPHVEGEEDVLRKTVKQDAMRSARDAAADRGARNVFADVFIAGQQVDTTFSRADVREQLFSVLFDEWKMEGDKRVITAYSPYHENSGRRFFYTSCCPSCAAVQVVDAVQTWSLEKYGQPLKYGPITWDCKCCSLYTPYGVPVRQLPYPVQLAPAVPTMSR